jgi:hypothetical protein
MMHDYLRGAVAGRPNVATVIDAYHRGVAARVARGAGEVVFALGNQELPAAVGVREANFARRHGQVRKGVTRVGRAVGASEEQTLKQTGK